ncbi:MAG: branched-chain amino acid ABC transporter permease [Nitrospinota bacterium]
MLEFLLNPYLLTIPIYACIASINALGLNIIMGYAGQINLGFTVMVGGGAYTAAMLTVYAGFSFWAALPLAILGGTLFGLIMSLPALRVGEDFLAIVTIGTVFIFESLLTYLPWFGGPEGIGGIPYPGALGYEFGYKSIFLLVFGFLILTIIVNKKLVSSWIGLAWESLREDELAARVMTINAVKFKILAFVIGGAYGGLGGALYAHFTTFISPIDFAFIPSVFILVMVVFGGIGTIRGPVVGASILAAMPEIFRFISDYRFLLYGGLLVFMMLVMPDGLLGDNSIIWRRLRGLRGNVRSGEVAAAHLEQGR